MRAWLALLLIGGWLAVTAEWAVAKGKRVALVVGNSAYQHTSVLTNPRHDATDVAAVLKGLGFHVVEGLDLGKTEMDRTVRDFAEALSGAQVGLFFYAGHGLQVSGDNYLVPIDAKLTTAAALDFEMVRLALIQRVMEQATETNIVFLDACRDNPLARNLARAMGTRSGAIGRGLAVVESGVGTLISFSTQPGNVALDGTGRNSPFASALVQHLTTSREDLSTILIGVRNMVMAETSNRQVPWEHSALRARFYLHEAALGGAITTAPLQLGEAAQAWSATKDTTSVAVLRAYVAKYDGTVFGELARARLKELEEKPHALSAPADLAAPQPTNEHPFDGIWVGAFKGGEACPVKSGPLQMVIQRSVVLGWGVLVNAKGELSADRPSLVNPNVKNRNTIKLSGNSGTGTYLTLGGPCTGTTEFQRSIGSALAMPALAEPGKGAPARPGSAGAFDGVWRIDQVAQKGCRNPKLTFSVTVSSGVVAGVKEGLVAERGALQFVRSSGVDDQPMHYSGTLKGNTGSGKFSKPGFTCSGTFTASRS